MYIDVNGSAECQIGGTVLFEECANYRRVAEGLMRKNVGSEGKRIMLGI